MAFVMRSAGTDSHRFPHTGSMRYEKDIAQIPAADDYFDLHHTHDDTFDKIVPARINQATAAYVVFAWLAAQAPISFGSGQNVLKPKK